MSESWLGGWYRVWWVDQRAEKKTARWSEDSWGAGVISGWAGEWTQYWGWRWWAGQTARQWAERRAGGFIEGWGLGKTTANWVGSWVGQWTQAWVSSEQSLGAGWFIASAASVAIASASLFSALSLVLSSNLHIGNIIVQVSDAMVRNWRDKT